MRTIPLVVICVLLSGWAIAMPTAEVSTKTLRVSATAHTLESGADASSRIFELSYGVTPTIGIEAELARIADDFGKTSVANAYVKLPLDTRSSSELKTSAYIGATMVRVDLHGLGAESRVGPALGIIAETPVAEYTTAYGRAGVAFLASTMFTFDLGIKYEIRPGWHLSTGFRGYTIGSSALGGFLAGATYTISL